MTVRDVSTGVSVDGAVEFATATALAHGGLFEVFRVAAVVAVVLVALPVLAACGGYPGGNSPPSGGAAAVDGVSSDTTLPLDTGGSIPTLVDPDDPYREVFKREIAQTKSDFVRTVLKDHQVTDDEYREAQRRFMGCLSDLGIEAHVDPGVNGVDSISYPSSVLDENGSVIQGCSDDWFGPVESLYSSIKENPNNVDYVDALAACFVRQRIVPDGFTGRDLRPLINQTSTVYSTDKDGNATPISVPTPGANPTLPGGVLLQSDETVDCYQRPFQAVRD